MAAHARFGSKRTTAKWFAAGRKKKSQTGGLRRTRIRKVEELYGANLRAKALAQGSLAFVNAYSSILTETENKLEKQIEKENRAPPKTLVGKVRRKGGKVIHSKQVLLAIVLLNILDCILVLGELILDIYFLKGILENAEDTNTKFVMDMKSLYPQDISFIKDDDISRLYYELLNANVDWDGHPPTIGNLTNHNSSSHSVHKRASGSMVGVSDGHGNTGNNGSDPGYHEPHHGHSIEEDIAHAFHKASVTILAILAAETIFKVFCYGTEFFENKLEVFDGFIVFASFAVDLVFIKGFSGMHIRDLVVILAFLVPWRVIRVVNSLVVAVIDHEHFRMKLLYKQKKEVSAELKTAQSDNKILQSKVDVLKKLAMSRGLTESEVNRHIVFLQTSKSKKKSSNSLAAFAANFRSSASLTSSLNRNNNNGISSSTSSIIRNSVSSTVSDTISEEKKEDA